MKNTKIIYRSQLNEKGQAKKIKILNGYRNEAIHTKINNKNLGCNKIGKNGYFLKLRTIQFDYTEVSNSIHGVDLQKTKNNIYLLDVETVACNPIINI